MENIRSYSFTDFMEFFAIMNLIVNIPIFVKLTDRLDGSCYGRPELAEGNDQLKVAVA